MKNENRKALDPEPADAHREGGHRGSDDGTTEGPDSATRRKLAVDAGVDPRTIERVLLGLPVRGMPGHRAREAVKQAGFAVASKEKP